MIRLARVCADASLLNRTCRFPGDGPSGAAVLSGRRAFLIYSDFQGLQRLTENDPYVATEIFRKIKTLQEHGLLL
jgi:hypothetical protein